MAQCTQCSRPAMFEVANHPLCVVCWSIIKDRQHQDIEYSMAMMNHAAAEMDAISGFISTPRIQIPRRVVVHHGDTVLNNINVANSTVGSINTGHVKTIDVSITALNQSNDPQMAEALKGLTQAVINASDLTEAAKNEIIDQISYLAAQTQLPADERPKGMIKAVLLGIETAITISETARRAWDAAAPFLRSFFGDGS